MEDGLCLVVVTMHYCTDMCYYQPHTKDMSSYIAVQGTPWEDNCQVYGLTPRELRYLKVGHNL